MAQDLTYYRAALAGKNPPIHPDNPQDGYYRARREKNGPWLPVLIHLPDGFNYRVAIIGAERKNVPATAVWTYCADKPVAKEDAVFAFRNGGRWPSDPPPKKQVEPPPVEHEVVGTEPQGIREPGPGDNSGDLDTFRQMKAELENDCSEAAAYLRNHPIATKNDADKIENWRKRIADAAEAANDQRREEKKPLEKQLKDIDDRWNPLIKLGRDRAKEMKDTTDEWIRVEEARLQKEAEEAQKSEWEAKRKAAEDERERIVRERAEQMESDPALALSSPEPELPEVPPAPEPIVAAPKVMVGTTGSRRSARKAPATATIVDLAAAAKHYAEQKHPDLITLIQKLADKAAKANAKVPGCRMSWETTEQKAAAQ